MRPILRLGLTICVLLVTLAGLVFFVAPRIVQAGCNAVDGTDYKVELQVQQGPDFTSSKTRLYSQCQSSTRDHAQLRVMVVITPPYHTKPPNAPIEVTATLTGEGDPIPVRAQKYSGGAWWTGTYSGTFISGEQIVVEANPDAYGKYELRIDAVDIATPPGDRPKCHAIMKGDVFRLDKLIVVQDTVPANNKEDSTVTDATPTDRLLYLPEDSTTKQTKMKITGTWLPSSIPASELAPFTRWILFNRDSNGTPGPVAGTEWSKNDQTLPIVGYETITWTEPSTPPVPREYLIWSGINCNCNGSFDTLPTHNEKVRSLDVTVLEVDLDVDSNMDGNPDNDDAQEMDMRGIIIDVNNDSDATGDAIDNQNGTIDGAADKAEFTPLWLRKVVALPTGWKVKLKVSDRSKLRIFDDTDAAIIGPVAADGGPDTDEFEVPLAKITAGDLKYLIEGFNYEHVTNTLVICDSAGNEICRDEVRTVINVDRKPEDPANPGYQTVRNYVNLRKAVTKLEGVEAKLEGNKPLISWNKPRVTKTTSFWVSVQKNDISSWLQTGVRVIRDTAGSESEQHYFEFVPNYNGWKNGTDPSGYRIYIKSGGTWVSGTFRVEITDRATGKAEAFYNGSSWENRTHVNFMATQFDNYQVSSEPKQSVARQPGSSATHAKVSETRYKDDTGWHNTSFAASDVRISVTDGKGVVSTVSATASGASVFEYNAKWIDGRTFEMWDSRDW